MEQLKVRKKDQIISNVIIYLGLAYIFLYLQYGYRHHISPFSTQYFTKSIELFWYVAIPILVSIVMTFRHHKWSREAYSVCILLVGFKVVEGLFIEFNKIIVIALFFYSVISYFLYQLLSYYLSQASVNPNYSPNDLFEPLLRKISCEVFWDENVQQGFLTNWDEEGCFIKLEKGVSLPSEVTLKIAFQGQEFTHKGEVVASSLDFSGVGIKFEKAPKDLKVFNWTEFTELVHELGFKPERLR